jgi:cytochrome c oxidase subunit 1
VAPAIQLRDENRLVIAHIYTATAAIALGAVFGVFQGFARAGAFGAPAWFDYYRVLTLHGVLMALVFTTFFITGLSLFVTYRAIPRERSLAVGWFGWSLMLLGTAMAALTILRGNATVLYTFYAPLKASPWFYIPKGSRWATDSARRVLRCCNLRDADRRNARCGSGDGLLIPWAIGWTPGINVMLTRMFFWYFGLPLVYFWIMGAYIIWYNIIPTRYAGNVFSDGLARLTFVMLILLSTPVGIHHEFMEPGISSTWKMLHTVLTYGVAIPSFITAFAIFASFELAAIKQGRRGFIATVKSLPWDDPPFSGRGIGNAVVYPWRIRRFSQRLVQHEHRRPQYDLDRRHFHVTVGGPVALTFLGAAYWMIPRLTGHARCGSRNGRSSKLGCGSSEC